MPEVQPVEYNEVTRAVPETGIRKAVSGIRGCPFSFGHSSCPLYKNRGDIILHKVKDQSCYKSGIMSPEYRIVCHQTLQSLCVSGLQLFNTLKQSIDFNPDNPLEFHHTNYH